MKRIVILAWAVAAAGWLAAPAHGQTPEPPTWNPETLEFFERLPIQDGGRVKPLRTYADFLLLRLNGKRSFEVNGVERTPLEWLLDGLFFPEIARDYETFLVEDAHLLDAIEVPHDGKNRRDRYSYNQLIPGRENLYNQFERLRNVPNAELTLLERQTMNLERNVREFEQVSRYFDFARHAFNTEGSAALRRMFEGIEPVRLSDVLGRANVLRGVYLALSDGEIEVDEETKQAELEVLTRFLQELGDVTATSYALLLIPPDATAESQKEWYSPTTLVNRAFGEGTREEELATLAKLEAVGQAAGDPAAFHAAAKALNEDLVGAARGRGEYAKVPLEVTYYRADFLYRALMLFVLGFLLVAFSWLARRRSRLGRALDYGIAGTVSLATILLVTAIVFRCIIRSRPPITTLYETILFITATAVITALIIEWINRQRIALYLSAFLGALGLFLANKYEAVEGVDTMPSLQAVLDTNFWLSTHVTTVTLGYAAGLLAAAIAHVYIFGQLLGFRAGDKPFYRSVARMVYGVICFGLVFSVIGTILGGVWANYSWGRFWGWDPKENGALMIVLWELFILHARMGGYIKNFGVCLCAILGGIIVAFSWFGTNLLGVGLHSYGFTDGVSAALMTFYAVETIVLAMGMAYWVYLRFRTPESEPAIAKPAGKPPRGKRAKARKPASQPG